MSIVAITGDHPRHLHFVRRLSETGYLVGWIKERRDAFIPKPPDRLSDELKSLFNHHFSERETAEKDFFPEEAVPSIETLDVTMDSLNGKPTRLFLQRFRPSLVLSYGCHKLDVAFLNPGGTCFWNTHGGLSPDYRGVTTHFWPSYFLEPQMTGMTLHETTDRIDGGRILFQTAARMIWGDTLHRLASRTVYDYTDLLARHLTSLDFSALPSGIPQRRVGRVFRNTDWRPEHLKVIYEHYGDRIVDAVLSGTIEGRSPTIQSVL